jgi:hypothetical protein
MNKLNSKGKNKRLLLVSLELIILIITSFIYCSDSNFIKITDSTVFVGDSCPEFYLEEPILYVHWDRGVDHRFLVENTSNFQELTILGIETITQDSREFLLKHNDYLLAIKRDNVGVDYAEFIDVSDLANPKLKSVLLVPSSYTISAFHKHCLGLASIDTGEFLFIQSYEESGYLCFNISDMNQPALLESYQFPSEVETYYNEFQRFLIRDNLLFVPTRNASSALGFVVYNITSLTSFTKIGEWFGTTNLSNVNSIIVSGDSLFLKNGHNRIEVHNIENITHPTREGYIELDYSYGSYFREHYLISIGVRELFIYDFSNITDLIETSYFHYTVDTEAAIKDHIFDENKITAEHIYIPFDVISPSQVLYVFDWSDPYNMSIKAKLGFLAPTTKRFSYISISFVSIMFVCTVLIVRIKKKWKNRY